MPRFHASLAGAMLGLLAQALPAQTTTPLAPTGDAPAGASGSVTTDARPGGATLRINLADLPDATYTISADGVVRAYVNSAGGAAFIVFSSTPVPGDVPLLFEPRSAFITVEQGGAPILGFDFTERP